MPSQRGIAAVIALAQNKACQIGGIICASNQLGRSLAVVVRERVSVTGLLLSGADFAEELVDLAAQRLGLL